MSVKHLPKDVLNPMDEVYLQAVYRYCYATAEHLLRRFHSHGALTSVQTRLKRLTEESHVLQVAQAYPRRYRSGSSPLVYFPARRGLNYLEAELGVEVPQRFRASEWRTISESHARHSLGITDLLVSSELLCDQVPGLTLAGQFHERMLGHLFGKAEQMVVGRNHMVPDALLLFLLTVSRTEASIAPLVLEYDRGSERAAIIREKVRNYISWIKGPYRSFVRQHFQVQGIATVAFVTPGDGKRAQLLKLCAESELQSLGLSRTSVAQLFCFTSADPAAVAPKAFFLSRTALQPFSDQPVPLVEF